MRLDYYEEDGEAELDLEAIRSMIGNHHSQFLNQVFNKCGSTLERLSPEKYHIDHVSAGSPHLPVLRRFRSHHMGIALETFSAILQAPLQELDLRYNDGKQQISLAKCLARRGQLPTLGKLALSLITVEVAEDLVSLIASSTQLKALSVDETAESIMDEIVPLLGCGHFQKLNTLAFHWNSTGRVKSKNPHMIRIPEHSLAAIGSISTLEQLRLTAGLDVGWKVQWVLDHKMLRKHFRQLKSLRRLAMCRDTYQFLDPEANELYYRMTAQEELMLPDLATERMELGIDTAFFDSLDRMSGGAYHFNRQYFLEDDDLLRGAWPKKHDRYHALDERQNRPTLSP